MPPLKELPDGTDETRLDGRVALGDIPLGYFRRTMITLLLFAVVIVVFLLMVHEMLVAAILGALIGSYLRPVYKWIARRLRHGEGSAIATLTLFAVPGIALVVYAYMEVHRTATFLVENVAPISERIAEALARSFGLELEASQTIEPAITRLAELSTKLPDNSQQLAGELAIDATVFLFTAFYVLTQAATLVAYLRGKLPQHYGAFAERLEQHVQGVLYGAVYSTLITQALKGLLILVLNLALGVPLPVVLALLAFVIGFFPVVGSWTIFVPASVYLLVFEGSPWKALIMLVLGFVGSTIVLSFYVRPKLAAESSRVLNFYWMFVALIAGVYSFGIPGIVIGPIVVGLLKAIFDTMTRELYWAKSDEEDQPEAKVFTEEAVKENAPPQEDVDLDDD